MADNANQTSPTLLLGRYEVRGTLGRGGFGTVIEAFDGVLKRVVAIKTLNPGLSTTDPTQYRLLEDRFKREAQAGARMGVHPNLVAVYDLVAGPDSILYLILEHVPNGTLAERIQRDPVLLNEALQITTNAARGLQAAHEHGIVHRDVKPANIFLAADAHVKVGDFGIAQVDDLSGRTSTTIGHPGTPLYMSPEQAHSTGYVRPSSDQYSLGLVLFEMLTGTAYKRLEKYEADALLAQQPPDVAALINRMLASEPGHRFPSMASVLTTIQETDVTPTPHPINDVRAADSPLPLEDVTRQATPAINLQPVPPSAQSPSKGTINRRAVLAGIGGLVLGGGALVGGILASHSGSSVDSTKTTNPNGIAGNPSAVFTPTGNGTSTATPAPTFIARTLVNPTPVPSVSSVVTPPPSASAPANPPSFGITSLLSYLDGKVTLPAEGESDGKIVGATMQVVGVDLSHNEPRNLPAVSASPGSRVVRTMWAPKGTFLATLVRQPIPGGFSTSFDLMVIDIATGKTTTVAKSVNTLPAWSPDGLTIAYGLITGKERGVDRSGKTFDTLYDGYDVHLVKFDGTDDRIIAHIPPTLAGGLGAGERCFDLIEDLMQRDRFISSLDKQIAWGTDNKRIGLFLSHGDFTVRPDGQSLERVPIGQTFEEIVGPTTDDPYIPANGVQVRLVDDKEAFQWRYENGNIPTQILTGGSTNSATGVCVNELTSEPNAGYRNQIVARLADGTLRVLTSSPTFKYHIEVSPDGNAVAFTGISFIDYDTAAQKKAPFEGYAADIYVVGLSGSPEIRVSKTGSAHHPAWQRDVPVRPAPRLTATPTISSRVTSTPVSHPTATAALFCRRA